MDEEIRMTFCRNCKKFTYLDDPLLAPFLTEGKRSVKPIYPDVAENLTIRTWVNRSERFQGAPLAQEALTSQTPDRVHFG